MAVFPADVFSYTRAGHTGENQDAFAIRSHPGDSNVVLCALADGQGGRRGGAEAAERACAAGIDAAACRSTGDLRSLDSWNAVLARADQAVARDPLAGFTTLVTFCVTAAEVVGGSCGDSAAVLVDGRGDGRILTADQPKNPPVASGKARFRCFQAALTRPWVLVAVSDGVWKYTGWKPLLQITGARSGEETVTELLRCAEMATTCPPQDDFTIVMLTDQSGAGNTDDARVFSGARTGCERFSAGPAPGDAAIDRPALVTAHPVGRTRAWGMGGGAIEMLHWVARYESTYG